MVFDYAAISSEILTIKSEAYSVYMAQDGLMKLDPNEDHEPFAGRFENTVLNHNGVLWWAYTYALLDEMGMLDAKDSEHFRRTVRKLEVRKGLYSRRPGDNTLPSSMDEQVAIVASSVFLNETDHPYKNDYPFDVAHYGNQYGWTFDNLSPATVNFRYFRQPSDIAFVKVCAGHTPSLFEMIYFTGAVVFQMFQDSSHWSEWGLMWLRVRAMDRALQKKDSGVFKGVVKILHSLVKWKINKWGGPYSFLKYLNNFSHPIERLSRLVKELK